MTNKDLLEKIAENQKQILERLDKLIELQTPVSECPCGGDHDWEVFQYGTILPYRQCRKCFAYESLYKDVGDSQE